MSTSYLSEEWKRIEFDDNISEKETYLISSYGRLKSLKVNKVVGRLKKPSAIGGYKSIHVIQKSGKRTARYIHRIVAETFIEKTNEGQTFVIHIDYDKENNHEMNLAWASKKEKDAHHINNPSYKKSKRNSKLNEGRVKMIKRKLSDPKRKTRMKMIAKQFGISEMQLYRIKTGENWGHVTID